MKKKIFMVLAMLVAISSVQSAKAWHNFAHGSIAYMAEQHLTPEAKEKCRYYLRHTLSHYASWMDAWRLERFEVVNKSHSGMAMPDGVNLDFQSGDPAGGVMGHLVNALAELGDGKYKNLPDSVVRQRLINMAHYVPDMHCPSHVNFPASVHPSQRSHLLYDNGKKLGYHRFWDHALGREGRIKLQYEEIAAMVDRVSKKKAAEIQSGSLEDWGRDIVKLAQRSREVVPKGMDVATMPEEQVEAVREVVFDAAVMGAYRLAHVINTIFADKNIPVSNDKK
uniref:S1/P1 nuclease n=1 Tax=Alistipes sp. TaxID=1872444 RepID=UPI004057180E